MAAGGAPHACVLMHVVHRLFQRANAVGLAYHPGVQRDGHDAAALGRGFSVQHVELVDQRVPKIVFGVVVLHQDGVVVHVHRVRHGVQAARVRMA